MIDHDYTDAIVCPHCGRVEFDSWEIMPDKEDLGDFECVICGKTFYATRNVSVTYSTYKNRGVPA